MRSKLTIIPSKRNEYRARCDSWTASDSGLILSEWSVLFHKFYLGIIYFDETILDMLNLFLIESFDWIDWLGRQRDREV